MLHFNRDRIARRAPALLSALLWCLTAAAQQAPLALTPEALAPTDPQVHSSLPSYLEGRSARFVDWLSDGSMLIATRFGDTEQIHRVRTPLAMREQQSFGADDVAAASARPYASDSVIYLRANRATGTSQLWLQHLDTHLAAALTDGRYRDASPQRAHDGRLIAFTSNRRDGVNSDIYLLDSTATGAEPRLIVNGSGYRWRIYDWSGDDRRLLLGRQRADADVQADDELFIADVGSGQLNAITRPAAPPARRRRSSQSAAEQVPVHGRQALFAVDGRGLYFLTRDGADAAGASSEYRRLSYLDPTSHEWRDLSGDTRHDVEYFDRSVDGHYLAYSYNDAGLSRLALIDQQRRLELAVAELPAGLISGLKFDLSGKHLALTLESARTPPDVFVFETDGSALVQWTRSEIGAIDAQTFVLPEALHFPTWDRSDGAVRQLSGLIYRGAPAAADARHPVLIVLCGGGGSQCRPGFDPFIQYLVTQLGWVVMAPDVRGASGYGAAFEALGQGALRDDAVRDVGSLLVWIGLQRDLDRAHVALWGEGFGAYLGLQSLAAYGDRLQGAIAAFGPRLAPLGNIPSIRRPLLLVQGLNNPAAPPSELQQLRSRLRADGVEVQYLDAADEAQQFTRRSNQDAYRLAVANFLQQLRR